MVYSRWKYLLGDMIKVRPVELKGRGRRIHEPFYKDIKEAVEDIYSEIKADIDQTQYALFGHSMGSTLVYELAAKISEEGGREPEHAFLSGRYPPHVKKNERILHLLPLHEFIEEILELGGTQKEFLENKELMDIFMPILWADYRMIETYSPSPDIFKMNCSITVLDGKEDTKTTREDMAEWRLYTRKECSIHEFDGGHFFIHEKDREVAGIIRNNLYNGIMKGNKDGIRLQQIVPSVYE